LSVFVTARLPAPEIRSLSLPDAVAPVATSVAVAVFTRGDVVILDAKATGTVNVSALPPPALTRAPDVPKLVPPAAPVTAPHSDVPEATQVALAESVTPAGSGSVTVTLVASVRPPLLTTTTYVAVPPGV